MPSLIAINKKLILATIFELNKNGYKNENNDIAMKCCLLFQIEVDMNGLQFAKIFRYRNWPRYGLRCRGWYCYPAQHELCRPSRGRLRSAQRVLCRIAVPTTTAQTAYMVNFYSTTINMYKKARKTCVFDALYRCSSLSVLERFRDPTITDTVTVSEQPHVTSSLSVFVNAEPVESCFEKRARLVQFLVELLSLNSTKSIDIN